MLNELFKKLTNVKGAWILAVIFILGLGLVFFTPQKSSGENSVNTSFSQREYISETEKKLCEMISRIAGAGSATVMVTLESSPEQYYERNTKTRRSDSETAVSAEAEESLVFEDKKPILVKEIFPEIKGVAVVCGGAVKSEVCAKIINLVSCALNVPSNRIYVTY